jgi:hypothetical protein
MKLRSASYLGVCVSDRAIVCAEVALSGGRRIVRQSAEFAVPAGTSLLDRPEAVGEALKAFLRERRFGASRAVVGVPARWMIALEKDVPPAADDQARALLRLQAERLAVAENGDMLFDFAGQADSSRATKVLLVGIQRQRVDAVERMLTAAGLDVVAITSSALALARGANGPERDRPMLLLGRQGAEMVWRHDGAPKMLRHMSVAAVNGHGPVSVGPLGTELGRAVALTRMNGTTAAARELMLWDTVGLSPAQVSELSERTGLTVRAADARKELGVESVNGQAGAADASSVAPALALAVAGTDRALLPVDFKRSRLMPQKTRRVGRKTTWAFAAGLFVLVGIVALYWSVRTHETELAQLSSSLDAHKAEYKSAENMVGRVTYSRGFFDTRPPYLECMVDVTKAFPRESDQIWVTTLTLRENRKGQIQGKASSNETVRTVLEALKRNPKFAGVQLLDLRDAGGRTREVTFSIGFNYIAVE